MRQRCSPFIAPSNGEWFVTTDGPASAAPPLIGPMDTILAAMATIGRGGCHIAVVVDERQHVLAVVSDGDVRRAFLRGVGADCPVMEIANRHPVVAGAADSEAARLALMSKHVITAIPIVDGEGRFIRLDNIHDLMQKRVASFADAFIVAGGEGRRLRPMTEDVPKPMLSVAGKPLIEHSVARLARGGVGRIHVAVNYLGSQIRDHLGDGSALGADICYIEESTRLGTAGALALLDRIPDAPLLVMNGDILTDFDPASLHLYHRKMEAALTVAVVDYGLEIPFGVVETADGLVTGLTEKPTHRVHINAGIYAIEPRLIGMIPRGRVYHMTDLIADAIKAGERVAPFLIHERWIDVGTPKDLERAEALAAELARRLEADAEPRLDLGGA